MDLRPAQRLLGDVEPERGFDDRRPAREHLRDVFDHHVPMGQRGVQRADPGSGAEHNRRHRHGVEQLHFGVDPAVGIGQVGAAQRLEAAHAAAGRVQ